MLGPSQSDGVDSNETGGVVDEMGPGEKRGGNFVGLSICDAELSPGSLLQAPGSPYQA